MNPVLRGNRWRRVLRGHDVAVSLVYLAVFIAPLESVGSRVLWLQLLAIALITVPMMVRSRWPIPAFFLVLVGTAVCLLGGAIRDPFLAAAWTLYPVSLAMGTPSRRGILLGGCALALLVITAPASALRGDLEPLARFCLVSAVVLGGSWALGQAVRAQRLSAQRMAQAEAQRAVAEERLRIARELHDVVSHSLSSIGVRAGVGGHLLETDPSAAREALAGIETSCRTAIIEMRQLLSTLRTADDPPQPGLDRLPELVETARRANVECTVQTASLGDLPRSTQLAAYRITQECLTNIVHHAAPTWCDIRLTATTAGTEIEVINGAPHHGRAASADNSAGYGIIGMRERARTHGGWLHAGSTPDGGFRVHAFLAHESAEVV